MSDKDRIVLTIRKAAEDDIVRYFEWANDDCVRKNAFQTDPIPWASHCNWFRQKLNDENSYLYVGEENGIAIGQVRFDISCGNAEISYSIDAAHRGKGLGTPLMQSSIKKVLEEQTGIECFIAKVKKENSPSKRVFLNLTFTEGSEDDIYFYTLKI